MSNHAVARQGSRRGDFLAGKYLLEECLGIGGMGEVYRATNLSLGRKVAIKLLSREYTNNEDDVLRFLREARAAAAVHHAHVVDVFDVARDDDGTPFIVQELLMGEDLEQFLQRCGGRLEDREALDIMIPVSEAVGAAHRKGLIHRDLKPANIFLARDGDRVVPKVLDFGACLYQTVGGLSTREMRMMIGTPHYMAPEQTTTKTDIDPRADVWALGVILYEVLTGENPFDAASASAVIKLVRSREVPAVRTLAPQVPVELERLVVRCLERDRPLRPGNASEVARELAHIVAMVRTRAPAEDTRNRLAGPFKTPSLELPAQNVATPTKRRGASMITLAEEDTASESTPTTTARLPTTSTQRLVAADGPGMLTELAMSEPIPANPASGFHAAYTIPARGELDFGDAADKLDLLVDRGGRSASSPALGSDPLRASSAGPLASGASNGPSLRPAPPYTRPEGANSSGPPRGTFGSPSRGAASASAPPYGSPSAPPLAAPGGLSSAPPRVGPSARAPSGAPRTSRAPTPLGRKDVARLVGLVVGPALAVALVLHGIGVVAPLGSALRGESALGSGILAVGALVSAAAIAAKAIGTKRRALVVGAVGAVALAILMIIVTFAASESAEFGLPPAAAALVPFLAPIIPLALAHATFAKARELAQTAYEDAETQRTLAMTSGLVLLAIELGPFGAVLVG